MVMNYEIKHIFFRYTRKKADTGTVVYAITLTWPSANELYLGAPTTSASTQVTMLGYKGNVEWKSGKTGGLTITVPVIPINKMPCDYAWVFELSNLL